MPVLRSQNDTTSSKLADSDCPVCAAETGTTASREPEDVWVECEQCNEWYHWDCVKQSDDDDIDAVERWYCADCVDESKTSGIFLEITYKDQPRKTSRRKTQLNYANLDQGLEGNPGRWIAVAESRPMKPHTFRRMRGDELTFDWVMSDPTAFTEPILIDSPQGLDMKMPPKTMTVNDVADVVGRETPVEVMDVASQNGLNGWTLGRWADYFHDPARSKIRNVISLEVSHTKLSPKVIPPRLVRQIDWIEVIWPKHLKKQNYYPKVQKYCLMSVANCWTDWHVDFAASSVYYHILSGGKTFFFIRPTPENLRKYEQWSGNSHKQEHEWLGDSVDAVYRVDLTAGNTMIIPSGWIHAVYTPSDSLVFGGNFLHSLNIGTQLRIFEIEKKTKVPLKYRFPHFVTFCWFVGEYYTDRLERALPDESDSKAGDSAADEEETKPTISDPELTPRVLLGLKKLSVFLLEQSERFLPDTKATPEEKKWARNNLPASVPNPYQFATDFRALVLAALGEPEEAKKPAVPAPALSPVSTLSPVSVSAEPVSTVPAKRKATSTAPPGAPKFKNFAPEPSSAKTTKSENGSVSEQTERQDPVTTNELTKRARPEPGSFNDGRGSPEPVEVRTTTAETRVSRLVRGKNGKIVRERRTVTTVVERTVWDARSDSVEPVLDVKPSPSKALLPDTLPGRSSVPIGVYDHVRHSDERNGHAIYHPLPPQSRPRVHSALPPQPSPQNPSPRNMAAPTSYLQYQKAGPSMPTYPLPAPVLPQGSYIPPPTSTAYIPEAMNVTYLPRQPYAYPSLQTTSSQPHTTHSASTVPPINPYYAMVQPP